MPPIAISMSRRVAPVGALAAFAAFGAFALLAACGPRVPASRPSPAPARPAPTGAAVPVTPAPVTPAPGAATSWNAAYAPGYHEYVVTSRALVRVEGDTLGPREDSIMTRARISMRVSPVSAPRGAVITVDSFLVSAQRGAPLVATPGFPLAFQAQLDEPRHRIDLLADQPMLGVPCKGPAATLLVIARDLAVAVPAPLERGRKWTDSTSHALCRGGIPLIVASRHAWTVDGEVQRDGRTLVRLVRETQSAISGTGTGRRLGATIEGTSTAVAEYFLDPAAGRLHAASARSSAELRIIEHAGAPPVTSRQDAVQDAVLLDAARPATGG